MLKVLVKHKTHRHKIYSGRTRSEQTNHPHQHTTYGQPPSKTAASRFCSLCFIGSRHQRPSCRRWLQQWKWCQLHPDQHQYYPCGGSVAGTRENTLSRRTQFKNIKEERTNTQFSSVSTPNFHPIQRSLYACVCVCVYVYVNVCAFVWGNGQFCVRKLISPNLFRAQLPETYEPVTKTVKLHIRIITRTISSSDRQWRELFERV